MWKELIERLSTGCQFTVAAIPEVVSKAEEQLSMKFPDDLRTLLLETNGLLGPDGRSMIWPVERILAENTTFRSYPGFLELYMPFDHLLFFGDEGSGDQYAFRILAGVIRYQDIYEWVHENDNRQWFAGNLRDYLARFLGYESYFAALDQLSRANK